MSDGVDEIAPRFAFLPVSLSSNPDLAYAVAIPLMSHNRQVAMLTVTHRVKPSGRLWNPAADVYRDQDGWVVKVDLAGICADELELELDNTTLRIRGCRRDTHYREGLTYQQMEITYSRFEKTLQFPCPLDPSSISHQYHDGFLMIELRCL